jgi:hypothetical protein
MSDSRASHDPDGSLRATFDRHGFGFQYAVISEFQQLRKQGLSPFDVDGIEYPVHINGVDLHVDFCLRSKRGLLVTECKRVDPSLGTWCFARSANLSPNSIERKRVALEWVMRETDNSVTVGRVDPEHSEHQYHVGLEVKDNSTTGSGLGKSLDAAVTQAIRGASGMIAATASEPNLLNGALMTTVVPVIITTARLVICETDLARSDVRTGRLPADVAFQERSWIWYRVMTSASIRHQVRWFEPENRYRIGASLRHQQDYYYARSVAIVSSSGLREFIDQVQPHVAIDVDDQ